MDWQSIIIAILGVGIAALGGIHLNKIVTVTRETSEFFDVLSKALEDGKITTEELAEILKKVKDIKDAIVAIKNK